MKMKQVNLIAIILVLTNLLVAQEERSKLRTIEVIGYAETEVTPDEIFYTIELREYKMGKEIIELDPLDRKLATVLKIHGIEEEQISQDANSSKKYRIKRKRERVMASKFYTIKFSELGTLNKFAEDTKEIPIEEGYISKVNHSNFVELEESIKIAAIKNAKSRAIKLLDAIDSKVGKVIEVSEVLESNYNNYLIETYYNEQKYLQKVQRGWMSPLSMDDVEFKKIKLSTTIRVVFEIE